MDPLLLVLAGQNDGWSAAVSALGHLAVRVTGHEAIEAVRQSSADCVLCERVPGWRALVRGVIDAGGSVVLLGIGPAIDDPRNPGQEVVRAKVPSDLGAAIEAARTRTRRPETAPPTEEEAWIRFAESVATQPDLASAAQEICAQVRTLCEADLALLFLVDPLTGELRCEGPYPGAAQRAHLSAARKVATLARPASLQLGSGTFAAAPILGSGDVIGVIGAVKLGGELPRICRERLSLLTRPVASAIQQLFDRAALVRAEASLRESHAELERKVQTRTQQLSGAKRELEMIFDAVREPMALQEGFVIRRANVAWAERAGIPIREAPGQVCYRLLAGRDSPCEGCPLLSATPAGRAEVRMEESTFSVNAFHRSEAADDQHMVVHYRDVTEERRLAGKLRESERMAAVGQLASGAAHEINNPIGFVISNLRTLRSELEGFAIPSEDAADVREMIEESLAGAERVSAIVRGLREFSKLQHDTGGACFLTGSVTRAVRAEFAADPARIQLDLRAEKPAQIPPLQLDQALQNLLRNARQATEAGGRVRVSTADEGEQVRIVVADEGCGIAPEHLPRIFEPFFTTRGVGQGIGLGLTSVYGIVQRHGGTIQVDSTPGRGTIVTVLLPRAPGALPVHPERRPQAGVEGSEFA